MFGIGVSEMAIIGVVAVLLFGSQLPKIARSLGSAIPSFRAGLRDVELELQAAEKEVKDAVR